MANQPAFIGTRRQELFCSSRLQYNREQTVFTPGVNGSRIHAICLSSDDTAENVVEFGYADVALVANINLVPAATTPATSNFTLVRVDGAAWATATDLKIGQLITLDDTVLADNRGDFRIVGMDAATLTLANPGFTPTKQLDVAANIRRFRPCWSLRVPARAGQNGIPSVNGLDRTQMPWLDPMGDSYVVLTKPLLMRLPNNKAGDRSAVHITFFGGDY